MCMYRKALCTPPSTVHLPNNNSKFFVAIGSIPIFAALQSSLNAEVALPIAIGMVEHPALGGTKVGVAGSDWQIIFCSSSYKCGSSSFGRARPCQGRGGRFEPGLPLRRSRNKAGFFLDFRNSG